MSHNMTLHASEFLEKVTADVKENSGALAFLGHGSFFKGNYDDYSDLDVILVAETGFIQDVTKSPEEFLKRFGDLIICRTFKLGPDFSAVLALFGPEMLRVDFGLRTRSQVRQLNEKPIVLLDKTDGGVYRDIAAIEVKSKELDPEEFEGKYWLLVEGATRRLFRGEYFELIYLLGYLRSAFLVPMISRRMGWPDMGFRRMELAREADYLRLSQTLAAPNAESCAAALLQAIDLYVDLRSDRLPPICLDDLEHLVRRRLREGRL